MFEQQLIKQEPRSPLQHVLHDGTFTAPSHRYTPSPNHQFNIPVLPMPGAGMTLYPDSRQGAVAISPTPYEGPNVPELQFQQTTNQYNLANPTAQGPLAWNMPESANIATAPNTVNNLESTSNRVYDLDAQQSFELNPDFSLSLLGNVSLTNLLCDNNNAIGDIDENMSDSLRNMSLEAVDRNWCEWNEWKRTGSDLNSECSPQTFKPNTYAVRTAIKDENALLKLYFCIIVKCSATNWPTQILL